jgi:hypothetical protein
MAFHIMRRNLDLATQPEPPRGMMSNDCPHDISVPVRRHGQPAGHPGFGRSGWLMQFQARDFEVAVMKEAAN